MWHIIKPLYINSPINFIMVEKAFKCVICNKETISPRAHIPSHTLDDIIEAFIKLTMKNEVKKSVVNEKKLVEWDLHP